MPVESVGAVLLFSEEPVRLVAFYREQLGLPLEEETHRGAPRHFGCAIGDVRLAIHDSRLNQRSPGVAFSLTTFDLDALLEGLGRRGIQPLHRAVEMGGGARRVTVTDSDGNPISLVQLAPGWADRLRRIRGSEVSLEKDPDEERGGTESSGR